MSNIPNESNEDFAFVDPVTNTFVTESSKPRMLGAAPSGGGWDLGDSEEGEIIGGGD